MKPTKILLLVGFFLLCAPTLSALSIHKQTKQAGFIKDYVQANGFTLMTYQRFQDPSEHLHIYIEGDGLAWKTKYTLSADPTPLHPIALELALQDPAPRVAYIARPGQFPAPKATPCNPIYWSSHRFAPEVVQALNLVIDLLKEKAHAQQIDLIGFSGGGALAILLAASRKDIASLRTVAGNLDPTTFCLYHHVSPLTGSLDPLTVARKIAALPQRHFVGTNDSVVPAFLVQNFVKASGHEKDDSITLVKDSTHNRGWSRCWKTLLSEPLKK